jgi:hypothetical protein
VIAGWPTGRWRVDHGQLVTAVHGSVAVMVLAKPGYRQAFFDREPAHE